MEDKAVQAGAAETRAAARTNLFLAASLLSAGVAHPVRIRDLSAWGARVETAVVPEVGTEVRLVRGRLSIACLVTWSAEHFFGLRFASPVSVLEWMTHRVVQERRRIDDLAVANRDTAAEVAAARLETEKAARAARDLSRVSRLLESLGEALAGDPQVVARHGVKLHTLGLAMQTLAALAETIQASARDGAAAAGAAAGGSARAKRRA
ncbi:MAG TPA: hypothetical protein VFU20_01040 [Sphingomicrobium sp.]|nr:hypothetical protein [Sphingomicrobium sp.]